MRSKPVLAVVGLVTVVLVAAFLAGCGGDSEKGATGGKVTVTDLAGRKVEFKALAKKVVAIGPGALRLVCYTDDADKVVGIENIEKQMPVGRPYMKVNEELLSLPVIGQGGPDSTPDPEMLMNVNPDVIFAAYLVDSSKADELQSRTGIPVVVLSYGKLGTFDQELLDSIKLVGQVTGSEKRAEEVVGYIEDCQKDLDERTADVDSAKKPTAYAGGLGMKGTHGIESTSAKFPPLDAINATNVVDETGQSGSVMIDKEKLLEWDPDFIFMDESGLSMVKDDYASNPGFYNTLSAFKKGNAYGYLPYNYYTTNVDTAIADAYFMGKVIYPDQFKDVKPEEKADEIYEFLVGKPFYKQMKKDFGGFKKLDLSAL